MVKYYVVEGKSCCLNGKVIKDSIEVAEDKAEAFEAAVKMGLLSKEKAKAKKEEVAPEAPKSAEAKQQPAKRNRSKKK